MHLELTRPDDWHLHLRDGAVLADVVPATARRFARAIVMPNLVPPVTTVAAAAAYRERILAAVPDDVSFEPLMTLYLTNDTLGRPRSNGGQAASAVRACGQVLYPAGATTNSTGRRHRSFESGCARHISRHAGARTGVLLLVHGESHRPLRGPVFDRETVFLEQPPGATSVDDVPKPASIVLEHITTADAADVCASKRGPQRRRHDHRPSSALQPQCDVPRRA